MRAKAGSKPRDIRQAVTRHEGGAHLYAPFGVHWRAGVATLIPFAVLFFTTQPFGDAMATLTMGGYTISPAVIALFATAWAVMSVGLLHRLRFEERVTVHYVVYGVAGAIALWVTGVLVLAGIRLAEAGTLDLWHAEAFTRFMIGTPLLGAMGSVIGRRVLASGIFWHVWIERKPLPPVFEFVEGKHDRDEFERM